MKTAYGHLSYCSNIHPGEDWREHFLVLQQSIPVIKASVSPNAPMGIGLRLANQASVDLGEATQFDAFKAWLQAQDCYVFTMNGFPFGNFHHSRVKDQVHAPDWTTQARTDYTIRSFELLSRLLPPHLEEGGISTSPLSYRFWWTTPEQLTEATQKATANVIKVVEALVALKAETGKMLHLDIEPEPDGILENSEEFVQWYTQVLIPQAIAHFAKRGATAAEATEFVRTHVQLCYDVCHFAVGYESPVVVLEKLKKAQIRVGKIQISAALKVDFSHDADKKLQTLAQYNEPVYLHQVVAQTHDGEFLKFKDLDEALAAYGTHIASWRVHFHVPLFLESYGLLDSTQADIVETLRLHTQNPFTQHLEIETYTWGVLPTEFQVPLNESIIREIEWVKNLLS